MQGVYTAEASISGVTGPKTLMYLESPADSVIEILSVIVTQIDIDTSEQLEFSLTRITSLGIPTAIVVTPEKTEQGSGAAGSVVKTNVTASEPVYHTVDYDHQGVSNLAGYEFFPPPEGRVLVSPNSDVGIRLLNTPLAATSFVVQMVFREIGG